jgi:hypothetical protein
MTSCNSKTSIKISSDIDDETYTLTSSSVASSSSTSMQISAKTARMIAQSDRQFELYNSSSMQISAKKTRTTAQNNEQYDLYNTDSKFLKRRQDSANLLMQRANANLTVILNLVEIQISLEEDYEILAILENQKVNLLKILKKKSEKESNFKIIKNRVFSELQNKFSNLEKSVDQKLNTILTSIENNQSTVNF